MSAALDSNERRFYRDADRSMLGGVCAGIARYFGFNLCGTRFVALVALLMSGPVMILAYMAAVIMVPAERFGRPRRRSQKRRCRRHRRREPDWQRTERRTDAAREAASQRAQLLRQKCDDLESRLQRIEKRVTSRSYQIDQELGIR